MNLISRKHALENGLTHYFTGKPCLNGHVDVRFAKDGACKTCTREKRARLYKKNPDTSKASSIAWKKRNKERVASSIKDWRSKNSLHVAEYSKKYREENRESRNAKKEEWRRNNIDRVRLYANKKYNEDLNHKLAHIIRSMVNRVMLNKGSSSIGYDSEKLKQRIECQFREGMSWSNYGEWEIDHKIPVSIFLSRGVKNPSIVNALSNLQPLWKSENRSKGNRYSG